MKPIRNALLLLVAAAFSALAGAAANVSLAQMEDSALTQAEREIVSLAEAMPAGKYDFAPTQGEFTGVRTFGLQMSHIATVLDESAAAILGEKATDTGKNENGPESLHGKDDIVRYLKIAFAHSHKAMNTLTDRNFTQPV